MSQMTGALEYRRLRAPAAHGDSLVEPPFGAFAEMLARNVERRDGLQGDLGGRPWAELRGAAREALVALALRYTRSYGDPQFAPTTRLLLAGHQPELFHPGVWFKNFALSHWSSQLHATAVNLLIDNDLPHGAAIRCPAGDDGITRVAAIPFDGRGQAVPFEERGIRDDDLFSSFGERLCRSIAPWIDEPLVKTLWPDVVEAGRRTGRLGLAIAQGRHRLEARWGLSTLEVPLSHVCDSEPFQWFAWHLIVESPRLAIEYNRALADYRRLHRVRSRTHPVADLECDDSWHEVPFWIWSDDHPVRRRLFARRRRDGFELSDWSRLTMRLPGREAERGQVSEAWRSARSRGIKVRPRALITTMYARLLLSDLFLHGIGGAKYDQLTDEITRRFFGIEPPSFATLTATALLPVPHPRVTDDDVRRIDHWLRDLRFHPECHAPVTEESARWAAEKVRWTSRIVPDSMKGARHAAIARINDDLRPLVEPMRQRLETERAALEEQRRLTSLWTSREFPFCLFPEKSLCPLLLDLARKDP